ncbi:hypothetical protein NMY22_g18317 [Coprinellus aureogranulatus]|nr:hypothetical protein NMY22_g18317 [Coprinellus aureogranulatus]
MVKITQTLLLAALIAGAGPCFRRGAFQVRLSHFDSASSAQSDLVPFTSRDVSAAEGEGDFFAREFTPFSSLSPREVEVLLERSPNIFGKIFGGVKKVAGEDIRSQEACEEEGSAESQQSAQESTGTPSASLPSETSTTSQPPPPSTTPPPIPSMPSLSSTENSAAAEEQANDVDSEIPALESITEPSGGESRPEPNTSLGGPPVGTVEEEFARRIAAERANYSSLDDEYLNILFNAATADGEAIPRGSGTSAATNDSMDAQPSTNSASTATTDASPAPSGPGTSTGSRNSRMDESGRINWWRLYRFPAVNSPPATPSTSPRPNASTPSSTAAPSDTTSPSAPAADASTTQASQQAPSSPPNSTPSNNSTPAPATTIPSPTSFLPNFLPPPSGQTVVPVIVVGLQSVTPGQLGFEVVPVTNHTHAHVHQHTHVPMSPEFPLTGTNRQQELEALEDMLREAEAEAEADALLYDSLERLARGVGTRRGQEARGSGSGLGGLLGNHTHAPSWNPRPRVTVEEVEDEDGPSTTRTRPRREVDELFAVDEAMDLDEADDEQEDSDDEEEEVEEEDENSEEEEARDDYYRRG